MRSIKMNKKNLLILILILLMTTMLTVTACGGDEPTSEGEVFTMDFMIYTGLNQNPGKTIVEFANEVRSRSNGLLDITVRPTGELPYTGQEALRVVSENNVQIADANTGYISGDVSIAQLYALPFLVTTKDEFEIADGILREVVDMELNKRGCQVLIAYNWPGQFFWGTGETPQTWEDFKNLKIRTYAAEQQQFLQSIGASGVSMTFDEVPGAAQRKVIDGMITSATSMYDNKMYEYLDWGFMARYATACNYIIMNSDEYTKLPEDLKVVLTDVAAEYTVILQDLMPNIDDSQIKEMKEYGMDIYYPDETVAKESATKATVIWDEWAEKSGYGNELNQVREALGK